MNAQAPHPARPANCALRLAALLLSALLLAGCGQKGALVLPPANPPQGEAGG